jgi:hypothetical protein
MIMFTTKRIVALSLAVALLAGTVGVLVGRTQGIGQGLNVDLASQKEASSLADELVASLNDKESLNNDDIAYRKGYEAGLRAAYQEREQTWSDAPRQTVVTRQTGYSDSRPVRSSSYSQSRQRVVYTEQPRKRSFWQKHRDKLTVGIGAGTGAIIGGILGGKKWAAIGAGIGAGSAALYTYKIRKRTPRN